MRAIAFCCFILVQGALLHAQGALFVPNGVADRYIQALDIWNIPGKQASGPMHANTGNRFYPRYDVLRLYSYGAGKADPDNFMQHYLVVDNPDWFEEQISSKRKSPGPFYRTPSQLLFWKDSGDAFMVNPVLNVQYQPGSRNAMQQNTRGAEFRGNITSGLSFYSLVTENQVFMPEFIDTIRRKYGVVPGEGFITPFKKRGADFLQARGYLSLSTLKDRVRVLAGHDKMFIGNGIRSLILSDHAREFLHLRFHTSLGPFRYQNIFARLNGYTPNTGNRLQPLKYMAIHRASVQVTPKLELALSEMVLFDRSDSSRHRGFDADYLNPVILYRAVEIHNGSRDNALLAFEWKWNFVNRFQWYGQVMLDEFRLQYMRQRSGWWGNKYGLQTGLKYTVSKTGFGWLFVQAEMNRVRPYTYTHYLPLQSYTHYNQPLAHPLGSNFREYLVSLQYQPEALPGLFVKCDIMLAKRGIDSLNGKNFGNDIRLNYNTRAGDFNQRMFQGYTVQQINNIQLLVSYMLKHNLFLDARLISRSAVHNKAWVANTKERIFTLGIRLNVEPRNYLQ
ncbi:MAG: hypothetical protein KJS92_04980 [Bacteroidetes bacterium]|nr:hypothetical protein [Bacteroidota bacterium]